MSANICAAALRDERRVVARLLQHGGRVQIPFMVAAELRFGLQRLIRSGCPAETLERYTLLRADLEAKGSPIGATDLRIAAQALAEDALLVTDNTRGFRRVSGLRPENWLRR